MWVIPVNKQGRVTRVNLAGEVSMKQCQSDQQHQSDRTSAGGHQCVCVCVASSMAAWMNTVQRPRKKAASGDEKTTPLHGPPDPTSHSNKDHLLTAHRPPLPFTHTDQAKHMWFISTAFKVPRTGSHYDSVPLTATLGRWKPWCVS